MQDWQVAKRKQDLHLDNIEKGLSTLKGIGEAMGETLKTQDVLIDTIDTKVATACQFVLVYMQLRQLDLHMQYEYVAQHDHREALDDL